MKKIINIFDKESSICVKGFAILFMLFHHCFLNSDRYSGYVFSFYPLNERYVNYIARFFKICVAMYVFISAYGFVEKLKNMEFTKDNIREFIVKNWSKLFLNFILIYFISFIANIMYGNNILEIYKSDSIICSIFYILTDLFGLAHLFGTPIMNATWWYLSLANFIIFIIPLFYYLYKKIGFLPVLFGTMIIIHTFTLQNREMIRWLFVLVLGVHFSEENLFQKYYICVNKNRLFKFLYFLLSTIILFMLFAIRIKTDYKFYEMHDAIIPVYVIMYLLFFIIPIKPIKKVFGFIGKYSMDIFFTHTFIREYFFKDFVYSFGNAFLIYLVFLLVSLVLAIVIGLIKKIICYDKFISFMQNKFLFLSCKIF